MGVVAGPPQLKRMVPPAGATRGTAGLRAGPVQLPGVPLPTTWSAADTGAGSARTAPRSTVDTPSTDLFSTRYPPTLILAGRSPACVTRVTESPSGAADGEEVLDLPQDLRTE